MLSYAFLLMHMYVAVGAEPFDIGILDGVKQLVKARPGLLDAGYPSPSRAVDVMYL